MPFDKLRANGLSWISIPLRLLMPVRKLRSERFEVELQRLFSNDRPYTPHPYPLPHA